MEFTFQKAMGKISAKQWSQQFQTFVMLQKHKNKQTNKTRIVEIKVIRTLEKSKVHINQENDESRKRKLKNYRKLL